jgi:hypothetical protein
VAFEVNNNSNNNNSKDLSPDKGDILDDLTNFILKMKD